MLQYFLDNLWRWKCGLPEEDIKSGHMPRLELLKESEWDLEFERLMRNRLVVGSFRYGLMRREKPLFDRVDSIIKRANKYRETGNMEFLVDIANLCLLEFVEGKHPNKHFHSIDDGEHVRARSNT